MLEIDMEFRKGILFVRLIGSLVSNTVDVLNKEVTSIVKEYGIRNVVFNLSGLESIDPKGVISLIEYNKLASNYNGYAMICGLDNCMPVKKVIKNSNVLNYLYETSDELTAINRINS